MIFQVSTVLGPATTLTVSTNCWELYTEPELMIAFRCEMLSIFGDHSAKKTSFKNTSNLIFSLDIFCKLNAAGTGA